MVDHKDLKPRSSNTDIDRFLEQAAALPRTAGKGAGRLLFAMDATASRQHSWDQAAHIQSEMFREAAGLGGLALQLCYFRGFMEFHHSAWLNRSEDLNRFMRPVSCAAGHTQILRCLQHAAAESSQQPVNAMVYVGDCLEEDPDQVMGAAGKLALQGIPLFMFQEGYDPVAEPIFRQMASVTRGAWCRFDQGSAAQLRELLSAVAVYAAGGRQALEAFGRRQGGLSRQLHRLLK